MIDRKPKEN